MVQTSTSTSAHSFMSLGLDNAWSLKEFKRGFRVQIINIEQRSEGGDDLEFDMIGIDPAIANALRRIMLSEIPTVAIEHVFFLNNTSVVQVPPSS